MAKAVFHNPTKRTVPITNPVIFQKSTMKIEVEDGKTDFCCACGKSAKQPFVTDYCRFGERNVCVLAHVSTASSSS